MRILMFSDRYVPEVRSAAHLFQDLAEGLAARGHDVTVLTKMPVDFLPTEIKGKEAEIPGSECRNGVSIVRIPGLFGTPRMILLRGVDQVILGLRMLWRAFRLPRFDVIVVSSPPLPLAVSACVYGNMRGIPSVLNLHDLYPRTATELGVLRNRFFIWAATCMESFIYRNSDRIVVPSEGSRDYLTAEKGIHAAKVFLIHNWVDMKSIELHPKADRFRLDHGLDGKFVISYAGLMGLAQDLESIIECARRWWDREDVVFLLVGDGPHAQKWREIADGFGNVRFLLPVSRERYYDVLRVSDVCLMPLTSALESPAIPGKLPNIMAAGKPVVAIVPSASNAAEMVRRCECGFVVEPSDAEGLERVLFEVYDNPSLGESLGRNGRRYAEEHFDLERAVSRFARIIEHAAREPSPHFAD